MKTKIVKIGNRKVGDGHPCFIIAEAGSNHNGKLEQAKKLIDVAAESGADAVKFQLFTAKNLYVGAAGSANYLKNGQNIYDIIKRMEMPVEWLDELSSYSDKRGLIFTASVFDERMADALDEYVPVFKIASYELNHLPLIRYVSAKGKPMIMSTAASTMEEIEDAVEAAQSQGNKDICLMQCVAAYPTPLKATNASVIPALKQKFGLPVGLSDHSRDPVIAPVVAVSLGADLIEKHFTLDRLLPGPDHKFAIEPDELKLMVSSIRNAEKVVGSPKKEIQLEEKELKNFAKRAVHAITDISKGEVFTKNNISILRPGKTKAGVAPKFFDDIIGRPAKRHITKWEGIQTGDY